MVSSFVAIGPFQGRSVLDHVRRIVVWASPACGFCHMCSCKDSVLADFKILATRSSGEGRFLEGMVVTRVPKNGDGEEAKAKKL